jgi:hypothetical protein
MITRKMLAVFSVLLAVGGCISTAANRGLPPNSSETVAVRAVTYEWMAYPGVSDNPAAPLVSFPRVLQSDCGSMNLAQCQALYDCVRSNGKSGHCDQQFFSSPGKAGTVPHKFGGAGGVRPAKINPFWLQASWFVDGSNTSTCASDANNCSQSTCGSAGSNQGPCADDGEVFARWATVAPAYAQDTTITEMTSAANIDNPIVWDPIVMPLQPDSSAISVTLLWKGNPTVVTTTSISSITQKTASTNTRLNVVLGTPGAVDQMLIDTTQANSVAWVGQSSVAARITQPMAPLTIPTGGTAINTGVENNAWATSDTVTLNSLPFVPFVQVFPTFAGIAGAGTVVLNHMVLTEEPSHILFGVGPGDDTLVIGNAVNLVECVAERGVVVNNNTIQYEGNTGIFNSMLLGGVYGGAIVPGFTAINVTSGPPFTISAGGLTTKNISGTGTIALQNVYLLNGTYIFDNELPPTISGYNAIGELHLEQVAARPFTILPGATVDLSGGVASNTTFQTGLVYGSGAYLNNQGTVWYSITNTAATTMPITNLQLGSGTTACCATVANPSVLNCNITFSATALGAGACSSITPALGNRAFLPGGGAFIGF